MRLRLVLPLLLVLASFATLQSHASDLALVGAKVYLSPSEPPIESGTILVHSGHILSVGPIAEDSITWHFGNFGEPRLVAATKAGLHEPGLHELALCFHEAKELMLPLLAERTETDGDPDELVERRGLRGMADELNRRSWALAGLGPGKSVVYEAWIKYARQHPERVFSG